jgi:hypothetical protein
MIKAIYGEKGTGKTRALVKGANDMADENYGCVVFIDHSNHRIHDLKHGVRFINVTEFPIKREEGFLGFLYGVIAQNYDVKWIFIDGITYILKKNAKDLENFFVGLKQIASRYDIQFNVSVTGRKEDIPKYLKQYTK